MANNGRSMSNPQQNASRPELKIYCDGRPKVYLAETKSVWAFVVEDSAGNVRDSKNGCTAGVSVTNNVADYRAVIEGLHWAVANGKNASVLIHTSLLLIVQQVSGSSGVKTAKLLPLCNEVRALLKKANATLRWIPKEQNKLAHQLSFGTNCIEREGIATL